MRELTTKLSLLFALIALAFVACEEPEKPIKPIPDNPTPEEPTPEPEEAFVIELEELTGTSCITRVTPADKDMYYVMYKSDISYFGDCGITNDDELFEDDMFYFKRGAAYDGITLKSYMEQNKVLFQGTTRAAWPGIRPGEQSVVYAYGVKFNEAEDDCEMITSIAWSMIEPPLAERRTIDFDVEYSVDGANVAFDISPKGYDEIGRAHV